MPYLSDVALAVYESTYMELLKGAAKEERAKDVIEFLTVTPDDIRLYKCDMVEEKNVIVIHWAWIKWYEEFPSVRFVQGYMDRSDEEGEDGDAYAFIRVGEDSEDIEQRCSYDYMLDSYVGLNREVWLNNYMSYWHYDPPFGEIDRFLQEEEPDLSPIPVQSLNDLFGNTITEN